MIEIATLGEITFGVDTEQLNTFSNLGWSLEGGWQVHEPITGPTVAQFRGPNQATLEFKMLFMRTWGSEPRDEADRLAEIIHTGKHAPFIIGGQPMGDHDWYVETAEFTAKQVTNEGIITVIEADVTLKEYR